MRDQDIKEIGPGRPREFDEAVVLSQITELFWDRGYEATGLSDIMAATGLKKGSLYAAFGNKQAMYHKALLFYEQDVVAKGCAMLTGEGAPGERLNNFLIAPVDAAFVDKDFRGCFLCNAATETGSGDPETCGLIAQGFDRLEKALTRLMRDYRPELRNDACLEKAQTLLTLYAGLRVMGRSNAPRGRLETARDAGLALARH